MERKNINSTIPVFFISPNDVFPQTVVSMVSILENTKSFVDFYILDRKTLPISRSNKEKVDKLHEVYGNFSIKYISIDLDIFSDLKSMGYITNDAYFRYMIPNLVPELKKVIYLDIDTIIKCDINCLYNEDIESYYMGAVNHPLKLLDNDALFYEVISKLQLDNPYFYVNSGVLLFNCEKFRENNISEVLLQKTIELEKKIFWGDQDVINIVLQGKIKELPWKYNGLMDYFKNGYLAKDAAIIHYNGPKKPWNNKVFLDDLFWKYAKKTPFLKEIKNIYRKIQQKNTISYYLFNIFPLMIVKTDNNRTFWKLFGYIPIFKITRR